MSAFISLITRNGTGDVNNLIKNGDGYPGAPAKFAGDPTLLAQPGSQSNFVVVEAMWADVGAKHEPDPTLAQVLNGAAGRVG